MRVVGACHDLRVGGDLGLAAEGGGEVEEGFQGGDGRAGVGVRPHDEGLGDHGAALAGEGEERRQLPQVALDQFAPALEEAGGVGRVVEEDGQDDVADLGGLDLQGGDDAEVLATAGTEDKRDFLRELGVAHVAQVAFFAGVTAAGVASADGDTLLAELGRTPDDRDRRTLLEARIADHAATVLNLPPERAAQDSLTALELRNRIQRDTGLDIPRTIMWTHPSVTALTG
ncbi:acyl carrier protein [Actinomadura sp. KC216]|uniref:acyl carrier protein n=1 Tax=Actinomadura sp. KC216 TaxID=2530370 RepID=UPI0014043DB4|nr:acyl carrier protein [Actinomadura sp. KC216]